MARQKKSHQPETDLIEDDIVMTEEVAEGATEETTPSAEDLVMTPEDIRLVEAMLFASSNAITEAQIAERFPADRAGIIPEVLEHLRTQYEGRGVNLVQRDKRWALRTATDLGDQLRLEKEQPKKFTRAAMETMAVIAYHQPVTRAEIENIRGVATSPGALDALMEAGWIKPGKRREVPGRPVTWLTTQAFLDHFGLEKLSDLPGMDELKAAGLLDKRPAIEAMPTADLFDSEDSAREQADPAEITDEDLIGSSAIVAGVRSEGGEEDEDEDFAGDDDDMEDEDSEKADSDDDEDLSDDDSDDSEDDDDGDFDDEDLDDEDDEDSDDEEEDDR